MIIHVSYNTPSLLDLFKEGCSCHHPGFLTYSRLFLMPFDSSHALQNNPADITVVCYSATSTTNMGRFCTSTTLVKGITSWTRPTVIDLGIQVFGHLFNAKNEI